MYGPNLVLILIASVSARALAISSAQSSTNSASEDGDFTIPLGTGSASDFPLDTGSASIAGHDKANCAGDGVGNTTVAADGTPFITDPILFCLNKCIPFNTSAKYIGIEYVNYEKLRVFSDADCNSKTWRDFPPRNFTDSECVERSTIQSHMGGPFGSVQFRISDNLCK
ncbi:hypothetical protein MMC07_000460 [Pseudocyphellaria aurata]|nr:hypothetical protein [Pseudocyphellaria aurata]